MTPFLEVGRPNAFLAAAHWVQVALLGSVSTSVAVIAVALVGLGMLSGRVDVRRGATVILGCFILFGAASIAQGLRGIASSTVGGASNARRVTVPFAPLADLSRPSDAPWAGSADPYAGAAVRR